jgi:hypothetical protein
VPLLGRGVRFWAGPGLMAFSLGTPLKLFAPLRRIGYRLLFAAGVGVAVLFIAFSLLVDVRSLSVLLAAIGAALGALIVGLSLPKLLVAAGTQREKQMEQDLKVALAQRTQLAADIERLKAQQMQFQQVQSVLKLTLLEVDATLTDFKDEALGSVERRLGGAEEHHYIGVLRKKVKVMLGIDLARLRVKAEGHTLLIDGLHAEFQGVREDQENWLLRQIQVREDNLVLSNKTVVVHDDNRLLDASTRQQADLDARLREGVELQAFDAALEKLGEQWLRAMVMPMGLQVRMAPLPEADSTPFLNYLQSRVSTLHHEQQRLEAVASSVPVLPGAP